MKRYRMMSLLAVSSLIGCGAMNDLDPSGEGADSQALVIGNWSAPSSFLASGAVITGRPSLNLPVCRAAYDNGWHPGKFWRGQCLFEWGGQGLAAGPNVDRRPAQVSTFETLVNDGVINWVPMVTLDCSSGACWLRLNGVPQNAIDGGPAGSQAGNAPLPVCMASWGGEYHPGKWWANGCNIEYGGHGEHLTGDRTSGLYIATKN